MKRLFAFGCSFTSYAWPMWPELLAQDYDETYNGGFPGSGNTLILHKLNSAILKYNICSSDTIIIQWTEPFRHDYISEKSWIGLGSESAAEIIRAGVERIISNETIILKQITLMASVTRILNSIGCKWHFLFLNKESMVHKIDSTTLNLHPPEIENFKNMVQYIKNYSHKIVDNESMVEFIGGKQLPLLIATYRKGEFHDDHPTPRYTLEYLLDIASNKIEIKRRDAMDRLALIIEDKIPRPKYNQETINEICVDAIKQNNLKTTIKI